MSLVVVVVTGHHLLEGILVRGVKEHAGAIVLKLLGSDHVFGDFFGSVSFFLVILVKESAVDLGKELEFELIQVVLVDNVIAGIGVHLAMIALTTDQVLVGEGLLEV